MAHSNKKIYLEIPDHVKQIAETIDGAGFDVYVVGGCVRDGILNKKINDWDLTTNAKPEEIQNLFEHTVYENEYGTVGVVCDDHNNEIVEITPYRKEGKYSDDRRPDSISFDATLEEDLSRRDFTINALAYNPIKNELEDFHNGIEDLKNGVIRTVGKPINRFDEDALRLLRAIRIATLLNFSVEKETLEAIKINSKKLQNIAVERIRDEFVKILMCEHATEGIFKLEETKLLEEIIPELREGIDIEQNGSHKFDVFEHNIRTMEHACVKNLSINLRLASLLHDIGKPATREWSDERGEWSFHNHEVVGAKIASKVLKRLSLSSDSIDVITLLVRWHMFFSDTEKITLSAIRRMIARVGEENIWDLIDLRMCDRIGTGRPKENPYRLRKYVSLVEEVLREPITPGMLALSGKDLIVECGMEPGPTMGYILHILLAEVLDDPEKNKKGLLIERVNKLKGLPVAELKEMGEAGKIKKMEEDNQAIEAIKKKYFVD